MSVNMRNVVMLGVKLDYKCFPEDGYDKFEDYILQFDKEKDKGVRMLVDGSSGEYLIIGFPIVYSEDYQDGMMDMPLTKFWPDEVQIDEILEFIAKNIPDVKMVDCKIQYIALSHYS